MPKQINEFRSRAELRLRDGSGGGDDPLLALAKSPSSPSTLLAGERKAFVTLRQSFLTYHTEMQPGESSKSTTFSGKEMFCGIVTEFSWFPSGWGAGRDRETGPQKECNQKHRPTRNI